MKLYFEESSTS